MRPVDGTWGHAKVNVFTLDFCDGQPISSSEVLSDQSNLGSFLKISRAILVTSSRIDGKFSFHIFISSSRYEGSNLRDLTSLLFVVRVETTFDGWNWHPSGYLGRDEPFERTRSRWARKIGRASSWSGCHDFNALSSVIARVASINLPLNFYQQDF